MNLDDAMEKEEEQLYEQYQEGYLSLAQYNIAMRDLQRDYADMVRDEAQAAYDDVLDAHGWRWRGMRRNHDHSNNR